MDLDYTWLSYPLYQSWIFHGVVNTLVISLLGIVLMLVIGVVCASILHFNVAVISDIVKINIDLLRNTPSLVQLFFLYFVISEIGLHFVDTETGRPIPLFSGFTCVVLALGAYSGSVAAEIIRSGFMAVPRETIEGARALGYRRIQIFYYVELPMSFRLTIPAMTNNVVSLIKTSSMSLLVAVPDLLYYATQITLENFRNMEVMIMVWLIYVLICASTVFVINRIAASTRIPGFGS